jgi:hypothetical protein
MASEPKTAVIGMTAAVMVVAADDVCVYAALAWVLRR